MEVDAMFRRLSLMVGAALLIGGCASGPQAQRAADRQAAYTVAAGAPVRSFRFVTLYSWEPLGTSHLAVYTRPHEAWLLDVGSCPDLPYTPTIGLTSNLNQVMVNFDKVLIGRSNFPCRIVQIRPVDVKQLKAVQKQQRMIRSEPRDTEPDKS
jgi:hypothetical protein